MFAVDFFTNSFKRKYVKILFSKNVQNMSVNEFFAMSNFAMRKKGPFV